MAPRPKRVLISAKGAVSKVKTLVSIKRDAVKKNAKKPLVSLWSGCKAAVSKVETLESIKRDVVKKNDKKQPRVPVS